MPNITLKTISSYASLMLVASAVNAVPSSDGNVDMVLRGMSLGDFVPHLYAGDEMTYEIDSFLSNIVVEGRYAGDKDDVLNVLSKEHGFMYREQGGVLTLSRPKDMIAGYVHNLATFDMPISQLITVLAKSNSINLDIDSAIDATVSGPINGTLNSIVTDLALEYSLLIDSRENSMSIVKSDREATEQIELEADMQKPVEEWVSSYDSELLYPGNEINISDNNLTISGHPVFVKLASLEARLVQPVKKSSIIEPTVEPINAIASEVKNVDIEIPKISSQEAIVEIEEPVKAKPTTASAADGKQTPPAKL